MDDVVFDDDCCGCDCSLSQVLRNGVLGKWDLRKASFREGDLSGLGRQLAGPMATRLHLASVQSLDSRWNWRYVVNHAFPFSAIYSAFKYNDDALAFVFDPILDFTEFHLHLP
jgi:hypothetical protein